MKCHIKGTKQKKTEIKIEIEKKTQKTANKNLKMSFF